MTHHTFLQTAATSFKRGRVYWQVWLITAQNALQAAFVNRWSNALFLIGKLLRLTMMLFFLILLKQKSLHLAGYTSDQILVFFLTYQLVDSFSQTLFRGVYEFGPLVRSGEFDFYLSKPISPLFRALTGKPDMNDALFLLPTTALSLGVLQTLDISLTAGSVAWYGLLLVGSMLIATALHIGVLVVGVLTTEVDNIIWTYRDLTRLGQFPITMYLEPMRTVLFLVVPIGMMITIPSQAVMGLPTTYPVLATLVFSGVFFGMSLRLWAWSLKRYGSASS